MPNRLRHADRSHFAPHNKAYLDLTKTYPFDIAKAKALLAEAGDPTASRPA